MESTDATVRTQKKKTLIYYFSYFFLEQCQPNVHLPVLSDEFGLEVLREKITWLCVQSEMVLNPSNYAQCIFLRLSYLCMCVYVCIPVTLLTSHKI